MLLSRGIHTPFVDISLTNYKQAVQEKFANPNVLGGGAYIDAASVLVEPERIIFKNDPDLLERYSLIYEEIANSAQRIADFDNSDDAEFVSMLTAGRFIECDVVDSTEFSTLALHSYLRRFN